MDIAITGSSSYIGQKIRVSLALKGHKVVELAPLTLQEKEDDPEFDYIVHCSASQTETKAIIDYCNQNVCKKIVYLSTANIYSSLQNCFDILEDSVTGAEELSPFEKKFYESEKEILSLKTPAIVLRTPEVFGAGDSSLLTHTLALAKEGRLPLIGSRNNFRDLIFIENLSHAVECALLAKEDCNLKTYNLSNAEPSLIWKILDRSIKDLHFQLPKEEIQLKKAYRKVNLEKLFPYWFKKKLSLEMIDFLTKTQTLNITKAKRELGYYPQISLEQSLEIYLAEFQL